MGTKYEDNTNSPTRGNNCLDLIATSFDDEIEETTLLEPLENERDSVSDHRVVVARAALIKKHNFQWIEVTSRKVTERGEEEYDRCMNSIKWEEILPTNPEERTRILHENVMAGTERCFPTVRYKRRSTDCLLYTSPSPRDRQKSRMPSSA